MSQNRNTDAGSALDALVRVLTTTNALIPAAVPGIQAVVSIFKSGMTTGKTIEEMEAEAQDSMATALRTRSKSEEQMSDKA